MDVAQQERLRMGRKQRAGREFVVEAGHRHAVLADGTKHRAVGDADARQSAAAQVAVTGGEAVQQRLQLFAHRPGRLGSTDRRRHGGLVHGRDTREHRNRGFGHDREPPLRRSDPAPVLRKHHLPDSIGHVHGITSPQQPEHRQRTGRLVRERPLQHQDRAMIGQPSHLRRQRRRRRVQIQRMVGGIAGHHRHLGVCVHRLIDRGTEAAIRFGQRARPIVQIGEMGDPDHVHRPPPVRCNSVSSLSAYPCGSFR